METTRAKIITRRTYNRPLDDGTFESWEQTIDRVISHQRWLWRRARGRDLGVSHEQELTELRDLLLSRKAALSGRTYWLGGTDIARTRESSNFNCSFLRAETVHDMVDALWLLLQGCGVGAMPVAGTLNGFARPIQNIEIIPTTRKEAGGHEKNVEIWNPETGEWRITIGDSAEAWAKSIGKLLAGKFPATKLVLDFSEIRPAGLRLKGYGWVSSGGEAIATAYQRIAALLSQKAGSLLDRHDIHDILNWLGTILSTRRSSEIILYPYGDPGWQTFASFKKDFWLHDNHQRQQSNNSLVFWQQPTLDQLTDVMNMVVESGGSEPGLINGQAASNKAPWFSGVNPCAEILLGNKSFCNLVELNLLAFRNNPSGMHRAQTLIARANYRQTCVNLRDGVLQSAWHENNEFLRLCGVGLTGVMGRPDLTPYDYRVLRNYAVVGAYSMADELGLPRPKNVTTIKPSGTLSKIMGTDEWGEVPEGCHKPGGRYIFNNVKFSSHDPLIPKLQKAGYKTFNSPNPTDTDTIIVCIPAKYDTVKFSIVDGREMNCESAVEQLERYKMLMQNYVDHNCSITISYIHDEYAHIIDWINRNWDAYVGVSFIPRLDPTKTAEDLGYPYLPQEVVTKETYEAYVKGLKPINIDKDKGTDLIDTECEGGACPVR